MQGRTKDDRSDLQIVPKIVMLLGEPTAHAKSLSERRGQCGLETAAAICATLQLDPAHRDCSVLHFLAVEIDSSQPATFRAVTLLVISWDVGV